MITLNLTKEEIERLYFIWQRSWPMLPPDEEDTIGAKIQDAMCELENKTYETTNNNDRR